MIQFFTKRMKNKKGFTLIELVVVIAILGILAAIAVPRLAGFRQNANIAANDATVETVSKGINLFMASKNYNTLADAVTGEANLAGDSLAQVIAFLQHADSGQMIAADAAIRGEATTVWSWNTTKMKFTRGGL